MYAKKKEKTYIYRKKLHESKWKAQAEGKKTKLEWLNGFLRFEIHVNTWTECLVLF